MQLFVKSYNSVCYTIEAEYSDTIFSIKEKVFDKSGIYAEHQKLIFAGMELANYRSINEYSINKESTLHMTLRFPGG